MWLRSVRFLQLLRRIAVTRASSGFWKEARGAAGEQLEGCAEIVRVRTMMLNKVAAQYRVDYGLFWLI
jgi:hypothetical protein